MPPECRSPEYKTWQAIRSRCYSPSCRLYPRYGGRGITICERWKNSYQSFLADMGRRPADKSSLDRIDNDGPYSPENCRWSTPREQANNRRDNRPLIAAFGIARTEAEWSRVSGIGLMTIRGRINHGWAPEQAVTVPPDLKHSYWKKKEQL